MYNIKPVLWGNHGWTFLHYITLSYPDDPDQETKNKFKDFFTKIIWNFLPCESCRHNYVRHLDEIPLTDDILSSRNKFIYWFVDMHNLVNREIGKKVITYDEFNKLYIEPEVKKEKQNYTSIYIIACLIVALIILFITYKKV